MSFQNIILLLFLCFGALCFFEKGPVAQWIRHLTTNQGIPGSNPGGVAVILGKLTFYPLDFFYILITFHEVRKPDTTCGA